MKIKGLGCVWWLSVILVGCGDSGGVGSDAGIEGGLRDANRPDAMLRDAAPPPALDCLLSGSPLTEDWGPLEGEGRQVACFEVSNDQDFARGDEVAAGGVPIAEGFALLGTERLVVIGADNRRVPAQFRILARWGGPLADTSRAIRWLHVSIPTAIAASSRHGHAIFELDAAPEAASAPGDISFRREGESLMVDTGAGRFTLSAAQPGLLERVEVYAEDGTPTELYRAREGDGAGPRLDLSSGGSPLVIDSSVESAGRVVPEPDAALEVVEMGANRVVVAQRGHFVATGGQTRCTAGPEPYESFGYTMVLTLSRGSAEADLEFHLRNECSDLSVGPWTDQAARVERVSFELPIQLGDTRVFYAGGAGALNEVSAEDSEVSVEQQAGAYQDETWTRRARVTVGGVATESAVAFDRPFLAVAGTTQSAYAFIPWMRFREPQAMASDGSRLSLRFISEPVVLGEARGVWNRARLGFGGSIDASGGESRRRAAHGALERPLLVRPTRATLNGSRVMPSVGDDLPSALRDEYLGLLTRRHEATINEQREDHKIFGSQVWPDIPFLSGESPDPSIHSAKMNYWNASRTELLEFWRSGDVRWVWDWSMMQTWTQLFSAYANAGEATHGNRNGFALTSGGCGWSNDCCHYPPPAPGGCSVSGEDPTGHWHRSGQGSDDYTYTHGDVAYAIYPTYGMQRRFAQAGRTAIDRYPDAREVREIYVSERSIVRQVIQHWVHLANCAEFVPGDEGVACDTHLRSLMEELARDNLGAGVLCMRDDPEETSDPGTGLRQAANPQTCVVPQQFMQNALIIPFFYRLMMNYGDVGGALRRATVESVFAYYRYGMGIPLSMRPTREGEDRPEIPVGFDAVWTNQLQYTLSADRLEVESCPIAPSGSTVRYDESAGASSPVDCVLDPSSDADFGEEAMLFPNRPQTVGWLAVAGVMEPSLRVCEVSRRALEDSAFLSLIRDYDTGQPDGWMKGPAQISQGLIFGLGAYEACQRPMP